VSGLLASWELVGITLNTKDKWGIELKSPAAVPLILVTLVVYSGYRLTIEWLQCDQSRRDHPAVKIDHRVAHGIAGMAIGVLLAQSVWRIQIADVLVRDANQNSFYLGLCVAFLIAYFRRSVQNWRKTSRWQWRRIRDVSIVSVTFLATITMALLTLKGGFQHFAVACLFGAVAGALVEAFRVTWGVYTFRQPWHRKPGNHRG